MQRAEVLRLAGRLYAGPALRRWLSRQRPRICPFEALLPHVPREATVLDLGCGRGLFLGLLAAGGSIAGGIGVDTSADALREAERMARQHAPGLRFVHGAPWPAGPFDLVALIDVVHHVPANAQEEFVRSAAERVAPGGRLLYKDLCAGLGWRSAWNQVHDLVLNRTWAHHVAPERVEGWARAAGLRTVHAERIDRYAYGHELRVFERPTADGRSTPGC